MSAKYIPIFSYSHFKKVSILQMGLESGLTTPEFLDMQPVSLLVSQERVAADVWFAALGDTPPPNYGVGGNPENQVGTPENTLSPMEPQTASLLTAPPPPLVPTMTNVPIVPSGPVPIPSPTSSSSPEPVPAPIIAASVLEADATQITDPILHPVPVLLSMQRGYYKLYSSLHLGFGGRLCFGLFQLFMGYLLVQSTLVMKSETASALIRGCLVKLLLKV